MKILKTILIFLYSIPISIGQTSSLSKTPGILESLELLVQIDKKKQKQQEKLPIHSTRAIVSPIYLLEEQLNSLILNNDRNLTALMYQNPCALAHLLNISQAPFPYISFYNREGETNQKAPQAKVADNLLSTLCSSQKHLDKKVNVNNPKSLSQINNILIPRPKNYTDCKSIHNKLRNNPETIYYCGYIKQSLRTKKSPSTEKNTKRLELINNKKIVNFMGRHNYDSYQAYCQHVDQVDKFCDEIMSGGFFKLLANQTTTLPYLKSHCSAIQKKVDSYTSSHAHTCIEVLLSKPNLCTYTNSNYRSLFPRSDCKKQQEILSLSRLPIHSYECPGQVGNDLAVNASRILRFFNNKMQSTYNTDFESLGCTESITIPFLDFIRSYDQEQSWGTQACYKNPQKGSRRCFPVAFNNHGSDFSFKNFTQKTLRDFRAKGDIECNLIPQTKFDPKRINYKSGCFITLDHNCMANDCSFKIMLNGREVDPLIDINLNTKGWYVGTKPENHNFSFINNLKKNLKIKSNPVKIASRAKQFLTSQENGIIHGIGCAEDLLPHYFSRRSFRQCRPIPFIITGIDQKIRSTNDFLFVIQTSIDGNFSPRLIDWNFIRQSVVNYQVNHPTKEWTLYESYQ